MLHYYAKEFFRDVIVSPIVNGTNLQVYVIQNPAIPGAGWPSWLAKDDQTGLMIQCYWWNDTEAGHNKTIPFKRVRIDIVWDIARHLFILKQIESLSMCQWWVIEWYNRADSRFALSQWETVLLCNDVSHLLGANLESALIQWWVIGRHQYLWWLYDRATLSNLECPTKGKWCAA